MKKSLHAPIETRKKILHAALTVAARQGFAQATTKQIARTAGVSEGILYHHFKNKQDLCLAMIKEHAEAYRASLATHIASTKSAQKKLDMLIDFHIAYFTKQMSIFHIMFSKTGESTAMIHHIAKVAILPYVTLIADIVRQGIEQRELKLVDPSTAALSLLGMLHSNIMHCCFGFAHTSSKKMKQTVKEIFFSGITT